MKNSTKYKNINFFKIFNHVNYIFAKLKVMFFYRFFFGSIGKKVAIYKPLLIVNPARIFVGDNVSIRDGVRLEVVVTENDFLPELTIGDNVNIEQNVHIVCGCRVTIGDNVSIAAGAAIVDVNHPYEDVDDVGKIGNRIEAMNNFVEIGEGALIGYGAIILPNVKIGKRAMIGAYAVVTKSVPDFCTVAGSPARVIKKYSFENRVWERC
jgi:acetyltransferase-like isoleucine patch superfamily enzyme